MKMKWIMTFGLLGLASAALAQPADVRTWKEPATGMSFALIDKSCYQMGTATPVEAYPDSLWQRINFQPQLSADEMPRHEVCVDAFWIGQYEVRVGEWNALMNGSDKGDMHPVTRISWEQAREFAERLSKHSGLRFRLPTEAEWEHACRAGEAVEQYAIHTELAGKAWYGRGKARRTEPQPTGALQANGFGLYDMLGNVWEWTQDSYFPDGYSRHTLYNPLLQAPAPQKLIRGGSFRTEPRQTRCAVRGHIAPAEALDSVGFRLVRIP